MMMLYNKIDDRVQKNNHSDGQKKYLVPYTLQNNLNTSTVELYWIANYFFTHKRV